MVLFLYTFVDAIDNPVYGFLSDRTRTRWGRRRPWLVIGAPLLALCFIAFFNIPAFLSGSGIFSYMLLMYILTGTLDSLINANSVSYTHLSHFVQIHSVKCLVQFIQNL